MEDGMFLDMNTDKGLGSDEPLNTFLQEWKVETPLPPRFQEEVWRRIERAEAKPASPLLRRLLASVLPRPRFALAYFGLVLAAGIAAGSWAAQIKSSRMEADLSQRYVQSIDPYRADFSQP